MESKGAFRRIEMDIAHFARAQGSSVTLPFLVRLLFLTPGFQFVLSRRIQEIVGAIPFFGRPLRRFFWAYSCIRHGCEIAIATDIGGGLYVPHPYAIVIGYGRIGENVTVLQGVTIGNRAGEDGTGALIGDRCYLGSGAKLLGDITIGDDAKVGANSVVLSNIPSGATGVGSPARILYPEKEQ